MNKNQQPIAPISRAAADYEKEYFKGETPYLYPEQHFAAGANWALDQIRRQMNMAAANKYKFPIIHLYDCMDKMQGRKEARK